MESQLFYGNIPAQRAAASVTGDALTFAPFLAGKTYPQSVRFLQRIAGRLIETFPGVRALRVAVGFNDARPAGGTVKFQIGAGSSTGANTTAAINWNEPIDTIKAKLNALSGIAPHDFLVQSDDGSYLIRRESGEEFTLTILENRLRPVSFAEIRKFKDAEDVWFVEVRFVQSALAFTDSAAPVLPPAPYFETILDGVTYGDGITQNEVQTLNIPAAFRGQFAIEYRSSNVAPWQRTQLFSRSDGVAQYKAGVDVLLAPSGGVVTVTNPETGRARFEFRGDLAGINVEQMRVHVPEEGTPEGDWSYDLNLNTVECWTALRRFPEIKVPLEIEIDVPSDPEDSESPSKTIPVLSETITIRKPLNLEGMATAQPVNWLRKPNPKTYLPYNATQLGAGQLYYEQAIGDGVATEFEIDHNLGVAAITGLRIIELDTGRVLRDSEFTAVSANDGNTLELTFEDAPAEANLLVTLSTPQSLEFFINDLEIEIAQVQGLADIISDLTGRVVDLEAVLPSTGPGVTASASAGVVTMLPELRDVLFLPDPGSEYLAKDGGLDLSKLPERAPYLLPAIHDSATDNLTDPLPAISANAGKVYLNSGGSAVLIPGGGRIPSRYVPAAGFVNCDGRSLYVSTRDGTTKSYYPAAFERTLFTMAVNEKQLLVGRTLDLRFSLLLQMARALRNQDLFCQAQWVLRMEIGTPTADTTPATTGLNLAAITWAADPIFEQAIVLDELFRAHAFGVRIQNLSGGISLDQQLYGNWTGNDDAAPDTANFVLRARLHKFDTENNQPLARAFIFLGLAGGLDAGGAMEERGKALIS